jgi:hypothetical protein
LRRELASAKEESSESDAEKQAMQRQLAIALGNVEKVTHERNELKVRERERPSYLVLEMC